MKIRESFKYSDTTIASLKPYDMFVLTSPRIIYMYIMSNSGPKYLALDNGAWKDSGIIFNITEQVSIINIEEVLYIKKS